MISSNCQSVGLSLTVSVCVSLCLSIYVSAVQLLTVGVWLTVDIFVSLYVCYLSLSFSVSFFFSISVCLCFPGHVSDSIVIMTNYLAKEGNIFYVDLYGNYEMNALTKCC